VRKMRQSTLGSALDCAKKMEFVLDPKIPYTTGVIRAMGTAVHKGHEEYYSHRRETGEIDTDPRRWVEAALDEFQTEIDRAGSRFDWRFDEAKPHLKTPKPEILYDFEIAASKIAEAIVAYHQNKWYWPDGFEVIETELSFDLPWEGHDDWVRHGTIDLVLRDKKKVVHIVDHKTAKGPKKFADYSPMKSPQASYYLKAFELLDLGLGKLHPEFIYDVLSLPPGKPVTFSRFWHPRSKQQISAVESQANDLIRLIEQGGPFLPNTSSFLCSEMYCDYWDRCPYGSTLKS